MSKKIFLGVNNIASLFSYYKKGYEELGHKVTTCSYKTPYSSMEYDMTPDQIFLQKQKNIYYSLYPSDDSKMKYLFIRVFIKLFIIVINKFYFLMFSTYETIHWIIFVLKNDIFHFIWLIDKVDDLEWRFKWITFFGKKLIVNFVGDDIRWRPLMLQEFNMLNIPHETPEIYLSIIDIDKNNRKIYFEDRVKLVRIAEKYSDLIISIPDQAHLQLKPYLNFFLPFDVTRKDIAIIKNNFKPIVLHASTSRISKGTEKLLTEIERIQNKYNNSFDFIFLENVSREKVLEMIVKADIVVYSLITSGTGMFGMETIANNALLMTGFDTNYMPFPPSPTLVNTNFDNLEEKLMYYVQNINERIEIVKQGHTWLEEYAKPKTICSNILKNFKKKTTDFYYYPNFLRNHATFETKYDDPEFYDIINKWTDFVKDCDWYKEYVPSGERDGLIF